MGFEIRPGQSRMMDTGPGKPAGYAGFVKRVRRVIVTTIEAPTGTGKTFGYLVPVLPFIAYSRMSRWLLQRLTRALTPDL